MRHRVKSLVFPLAVIAYLAASYLAPAGLLSMLLAFVAFVSGVAVAVRLVRTGTRRAIWRLRNRLLVTYLFIAVVPLALILALAERGAWMLTGQIAAHLVTTALDQRARSLMALAEGLAATPTANLRDRLRWSGPYFRAQSPGLEVLVRRRSEWRYPEDASVTPPPAGWPSRGGVVLKGGVFHLWAHAVEGETEATLLAPLGRDQLGELVPMLGEVLIPQDRPEAPRLGQRDRLPSPVSPFDTDVTYLAPVEVAIWDQPGRVERRTLFIHTRYSAVLRTVFGQAVEWRGGVTMAYYATVIFLAISIAFLIVELVALIIGISLTRTVTGAVHSLYEGTQKVMLGEFSHRIAVRGNDQLAQLSTSFNRMTENLERLVEVAKEKERLQSELEIAREVQNQLFPRVLPEARTLKLTACCHPARIVSGDYYDYLNLQDSRLALAIGDVAGKGISAALLMATVQSTMRAQLLTGRELAAAAGNGGSQAVLSTATLVSRLNQHLYAFTPPEKFATFYFALYDDATGLLTYTNAGHPPPVLVRRGNPSRLEVTGMIVGAFPFAHYEESSLRLESGDLLVCFTDGVTEPENEYGEMYGEERLIELLVKNAEREGGEIIASVTEAVRQWTGSPELQDDMTMLLARRL
ncbi:MAG: PP2C family protein-serine/threonine phosphatase [Acidobacteriota bacterium]